MNNIKYRRSARPTSNKIAVLVDGRRVGEIGPCVGGWCYRSRSAVGETFRTVEEVKRSLETDTDEGAI